MRRNNKRSNTKRNPRKTWIFFKKNSQSATVSVGVDNLKTATVEARNVIQVDVIFHEDKLLNNIVPTGSDKVNKKVRKLFVCAKVLAGRLLNN